MLAVGKRVSGCTNAYATCTVKVPRNAGSNVYQALNIRITSGQGAGYSSDYYAIVGRDQALSPRFTPAQADVSAEVDRTAKADFAVAIGLVLKLTLSGSASGRGQRSCNWLSSLRWSALCLSPRHHDQQVQPGGPIRDDNRNARQARQRRSDPGRERAPGLGGHARQRAERPVQALLLGQAAFGVRSRNCRRHQDHAPG
jgi:hypothetical protein